MDNLANILGDVVHRCERRNATLSYGYAQSNLEPVLYVERRRRASGCDESLFESLSSAVNPQAETMLIAGERHIARFLLDCEDVTLEFEDVVRLRAALGETGEEGGA